MNTTYGSPFDGIVKQMHDAKFAYENTMNGLQNQLKTIQQNLYQTQQSMYQPQNYQQPMPTPTEQNEQGQSSFDKEMAILSEIKNGILRNNELLEQFFKEVKTDKNEKKDENDKGKDKGRITAN